MNWAGFDDKQEPRLPPSESDFFASAIPSSTSAAFGDIEKDSLVVANAFAPINEDLLQEVFVEVDRVM